MPKVTSRRNIRFITMVNESGVPANPPSNLSTLRGTLNPDAPTFNAPVTEAGATTSGSNQITAQQMEQFIRKVVQDQLNQRTETELVDEVITDASNLGDLDKTPDIVKAIRDFDGNPTEYTAWRKSVDRIFEIYGNLRGSAKYYGIISTIRNKIIGQANTALESYNTPLNWSAIKLCLNTHYADKRDISTLEYQMTTLVQENMSVEEYYQKVYNTFSLILNNVSGMGLDKAIEASLISTYRDKALDTFIRGLNGDLPRILAIKEPKSLPEALYLCTKLANQYFRTNYANGNQRQTLPNIPPKSFVQQTNRRTIMPKPFQPQLTFFGPRNQRPNFTPLPMQQLQSQNYPFQPTNYQIPPIQFQSYQPRPLTYHPLPPPPLQLQNFQPNPPIYQPRPPSYQMQPMRYNNQRQFIPQRPAEIRPQTPLEPMEVDRSIRSQQLDYANRRATTQSIQQPKNTQNFYTPNQESDNYNTQAEIDIATYTDMIPEDYVNEYMQPEPETDCNPDISEIHFLG